MSLSRVTVWTAGQVLTAAALNAEFNNILNNPRSLISPTTGPIDFANYANTNFAVETLGASPTAGNAGRFVYDSAAQSVKVDDGTIIRTVPSLKTSPSYTVNGVPSLTSSGAFTLVAGGINPSRQATFHDDFYSAYGSTMAGITQRVFGSYIWTLETSDNLANNVSARYNGLINIQTSLANRAAGLVLGHSTNPAAGTQGYIGSANNIRSLWIRAGLLTTGAFGANGTWRVGLGDTGALGLPANGIYIQCTSANGPMYGIVRQQGVESTLLLESSTPSAPSHFAAYVITSSQVDWYVNSVLIGSIKTSNVPSTAIDAMAPFAGFTSGLTSGQGVYLDYIGADFVRTSN